MPLRYKDDFELKALEKWQVQEGSGFPSFPSHNARDKTPKWKMSSLYQEKRKAFVTRDGKSGSREIHTNKPCERTPTSCHFPTTNSPSPAPSWSQCHNFLPSPASAWKGSAGTAARGLHFLRRAPQRPHCLNGCASVPWGCLCQCHCQAPWKSPQEQAASLPRGPGARAQARWGRGVPRRPPPGAGLPRLQAAELRPWPWPRPALGCPRRRPSQSPARRPHTRGECLEGNRMRPSETYGNEAFGRCRLGTRPGHHCTQPACHQCGDSKAPGEGAPGVPQPPGRGGCGAGRQSQRACFFSFGKDAFNQKNSQTRPQYREVCDTLPRPGPTTQTQQFALS